VNLRLSYQGWYFLYRTTKCNQL